MDVLAIKTAIVAPTTHGPPGGGQANSLFRPFSWPAEPISRALQGPAGPARTLSGFPAFLFSYLFVTVHCRSPKIRKISPTRSKKSPNGPPNDVKSIPEAPKIQLFRNSENSQKPVFLLWFRHIGPSSCGCFGHQNGDLRADHPDDIPKR